MSGMFEDKLTDVYMDAIGRRPFAEAVPDHEGLKAVYEFGFKLAKETLGDRVIRAVRKFDDEVNRE